MHVGHQYMADNFDPKTFNGLLEFKSFHLRNYAKIANYQSIIYKGPVPTHV